MIVFAEARNESHRRQQRVHFGGKLEILSAQNYYTTIVEVAEIDSSSSSAALIQQQVVCSLYVAARILSIPRRRLLVSKGSKMRSISVSLHLHISDSYARGSKATHCSR